MKKILISLLCLYFSGCIYLTGFEHPIYYDPKNVVIIKDNSNCEFIRKLEPSDRIWKKKEDRNELVQFEVDRLKGMAIYVRANAISNIKLLAGEIPLGRADAYKCPENFFDEELKKQNDKDYLSQIIMIEK